MLESLQKKQEFYELKMTPPETYAIGQYIHVWHQHIPWVGRVIEHTSNATCTTLLCASTLTGFFPTEQIRVFSDCSFKTVIETLLVGWPYPIEWRIETVWRAFWLQEGLPTGQWIEQILAEIQAVAFFQKKGEDIVWVVAPLSDIPTSTHTNIALSCTAWTQTESTMTLEGIVSHTPMGLYDMLRLDLPHLTGLYQVVERIIEVHRDDRGELQWQTTLKAVSSLEITPLAPKAPAPFQATVIEGQHPFYRVQKEDTTSPWIESLQSDFSCPLPPGTEVLIGFLNHHIPVIVGALGENTLSQAFFHTPQGHQWSWQNGIAFQSPHHKLACTEQGIICEATDQCYVTLEEAWETKAHHIAIEASEKIDFTGNTGVWQTDSLHQSGTDWQMQIETHQIKAEHGEIITPHWVNQSDQMTLTGDIFALKSQTFQILTAVLVGQGETSILLRCGASTLKGDKSGWVLQAPQILLES